MPIEQRSLWLHRPIDHDKNQPRFLYKNAEIIQKDEEGLIFCDLSKVS